MLETIEMATNPYAFPTDDQHGMTLRDYYAGQVIATIGAGWLDNAYAYKDGTPIDAAELAYQVADAMLIVREETRP